MLTRLKLENFKSWRNLDLELAPITLLFGTNSSGKTAILQSLLLLKQTANSFDRKQHINFGGGERDYVDFGSWRDLVYGHTPQSIVGAELEWKTFNSIYSRLHIGVEKTAYSVKWRQEKDRVEVTYLAYGQYLKENNLASQEEYEYTQPPTIEIRLENGEYKYRVSKGWFLQLLRPESDERTMPPLESCYKLPPFLMAFKSTIPDEIPFGDPDNSYVMNSYSTIFEDLIAYIDYLGPLRQPPQRTYLWTGSTPQTIGPNGENSIAALLASERQDERLVSKVSEWLAKMGLVDEFQIEAIDRDKRFYETRVKIGTIASSLLDVGFGVSQVLPVITLLFFAPEGSIILLEQPELHLHPNAQAELGDLLLEVAETRKLQLIVESHSEHLLRRLQRRIAEPENAFASPENIKMYFCQIQDGESKAEEVIVDQYGQIANWPDNFFGDITGDLEAMTRAALHKVMNGDERR